MRSHRFLQLILNTMLALSLALPGLLSRAEVARAATSVFINEIHYDNTGTDTGEAIEIAGPAGTDLTGWSIVLYNGANGLVYDTDILSGVISDQDNGFGTVFISYPSNGIQNGSPDGMALVDSSSSVVQFLSYEGTFTAVDGPAAGMTSTDIGVSQSGSGAVGNSLQLAGSGTVYEDFNWAPEAPNTFGSVNTGQSFDGTGVLDPVINEFVFNHVGTDTHEYVEIFGNPDTDYSAFTILQIEGDGTGSGVIDTVHNVGTTDANGFWRTGFLSNAFENGTVSLLLVETFTGATGDDLDTDNDGVLDSTPWARLVDDVAVTDGGAGDLTYSSTVLDTSFSGGPFSPGGASRIPNGTDTDSVADWTQNDFDGEGLPGFTGSPVVGEALNTPGAMNELFVPPPEVCGDPVTLIHDIQGSGLASPLVGNEVAIEGIVVGDFQNNSLSDNGDLNGFHVQEEDNEADADPATSEGIFVFAPGSDDVSVGDHVRVRGNVTEFSTSGGASLMTELTNVTSLLVCEPPVSLPAPTPVTLPVSSLDDFERYEGMHVTFPQALSISEFFNFDRFNEIVLTLDRQHQPTALAEPDSPEAAAIAEANRLSRITLDDGRSTQNPDPAIHPNGNVFDLTNRFRGGDTVQKATGVIDHTFGLYRIQPTQGADYAVKNPRPEEPDDVGGSLKVASFNVLNYFTTLDNGPDICGPQQNQECRGADNAEEFERQRDKIIAALAEMNSDVVGLIEIENHPGDVPTADLVSGLNDALGAGTYEYIATGAIGPDAIRVALIYKPATVTPVGAYAILDLSVDERFDETRSRPVLAQTFMEYANGGLLTVAVNHLKSKGSACGLGDDDPQQGNCNLTRTRAAEALVDWLASDPTGSGDADFLITGDLNAYDKEDPIDVVRAGPDDVLGTQDDYTDLIFQYQGEFAYSYLFDGQLGYLDHALASPSLAAQVTGATVWHINADEPDLIDYDTSFKAPAQDAIYAPDAYRSSDHDPVIVGLDLLNHGYDFQGFFPPISNPPVLNEANAGSGVPVNFSLGGDRGLDFFFTGYPLSMPIDCSTGVGIDSVEDIMNAGNSGLTYDPSTDQYTFVWKTSKSWADTCRQLVVVLDDGTFRYANFQFKK